MNFELSWSEQIPINLYHFVVPDSSDWHRWLFGSRRGSSSRCTAAGRLTGLCVFAPTSRWKIATAGRQSGTDTANAAIRHARQALGRRHRRRIVDEFGRATGGASGRGGHSGAAGRAGRQPHVELVDPVLEGVDGNDDEDGPGTGVSEEDVDERDDLQCLAETHAVRQDAPETRTRLETFQRLNNVVVEEPYATNLSTIDSY